MRSRNRWGPEKRHRKVEYKSAPLTSPLLKPDYAPLAIRKDSVSPPNKGPGGRTETRTKEKRAKDRLRIEHELPWVSYNLKGDTKQKPKQKPQEKPQETTDPEYFMKPDRYPIDLTNYPDATKKTSPTKTSLKAIPKKTPEKTNNEDEESPTREGFAY